MVAMAMPDTGLLEEPMRPTIREDTVAKKKPKTTTIKAPSRFTGNAGSSQMATAMTAAGMDAEMVIPTFRPR